MMGNMIGIICISRPSDHSMMPSDRQGKEKCLAQCLWSSSQYFSLSMCSCRPPGSCRSTVLHVNQEDRQCHITRCGCELCRLLRVCRAVLRPDTPPAAHAQIPCKAPNRRTAGPKSRRRLWMLQGDRCLEKSQHSMASFCLHAALASRYIPQFVHRTVWQRVKLCPPSSCKASVHGQNSACRAHKWVLPCLPDTLRRSK